MTNYDIVDKIDRGTAELLEDNPDAVLAWGDDAVYRLEDRDESQ